MWSTGTGKQVVMGCALALWAGTILACAQAQFLARQSPPGRDFLIIGHRGAPHQAYENTLESFAKALELGANALELDVSMTSDQHLVVWHDSVPSLENELRSTGMCRVRRPPLPQPIHAVPLPTLVRDYGYEYAGQRVPLLTFTEFIKRFGTDDRMRFFFLDVKIPEDFPDLVPPLFQHAMQTLQQYNALHKAVFLTPYEAIFHQLHHEAQRWHQTTGTRVEIAFDTEGPEIIQLSAWPSAVHRNQVAGARFALWGEPVMTIQPWRDFIVAELQRRDTVNATHPPRARMRFIVWTINDGSDLCALVGAGVDGIMTDDPGRLHALVKNWGQPGDCRASAAYAVRAAHRILPGR
jgi:glycerophosphoryl diester phosphodiesterase